MADERPGGPPATPAIGAVPLPPGYVLVEKLGSGGFATVWLAEQGRLGRRVAVKLLGETLSDSERERRFLAECRAIGRLSGHPAVVTVHDAGTTDDGHPYLVMEHLPGGSLHDRLYRQGPLPWAEVLDVGVHVADALAAAHEAGILHRDVKPANVLLDANGAPKLGDFGIARLAEGTNTATGTLVGTIPFTPPEVLSGHRPGPTADVWALGATLHTLLVGTSPFGGHRDEPPAATIARVLRSEPPTLPPSVPTSLRTLIEAMLRPEPRDRPAEAADVAAGLQAIQRERGLPVTPARSTRAAATPPPPVEDATAVGLPPLPTPTPAPFPPVPPPPGRPDLATGPELDADATTESGPVPAAPASPPPPPPGPDPAGRDAADAPTEARPAVAPASTPPPPPPPRPVVEPAGATSVLPVHQAPIEATPATPAPAGPGAGPPAPPPPGPSGRSGRADRRGGSPVLIGVAALVALVLVAGIVVALTRGGGDGGEEDAGGPGSTATDPADSTAGPTTDPAPAGTVDTPLGSPLAVPGGLAARPTAGTWEDPATCSDGGSCSVVDDDGGVVAVKRSGDGTTLVERFAADGTSSWELPLTDVEGQPGLAQLGAVVVVSSTSGATRTYRGIDDQGDKLWQIDLAQDDGPVLPNNQPSDAYGVLLLGEVGEYVVVDLADGETRPGSGRVLATDDTYVYVADGDRVLARDLATGEERWVADGVVSATPPAGVLPAWRYGTVAGDVFVTATSEQVVALTRDGGAPVWDPVPLSADGVDVGRPIAMSHVGDVVVVAAERGDLGIDARSGEVRWRVGRDRLVYDPQLDADAIRAVEGMPVWVGIGDRLLVGWTGAHLQLISVADGSLVGAVDLEPTGGRSSLAIGSDGIAILQAGGTIAGYGYEALDGPLWESDSFPEATDLAAIDGGLVVVDPTGLHALTAG